MDELGHEFRGQSRRDTPRAKILQTAEDLIHGDRQQDYGSPFDSFERIAKLWSAYLGQDVKASQVAMMMVLLKVSRSVTSPQKTDSYDDAAGYVGLAWECYLEEQKREEL